MEKRVIAAIQDDIPVAERPFLEIADRLGIEEDLFLRTLADLCRKGVIRRFGATIRHQKSGFQANAMTAWQVAEDRVDAVGEQMAGSPHVSHCYRRDPTPKWPYNLYTMIHAADKDTCRAIARGLSDQTGIRTYRLLFSERELKKTSMKYFPDV